MSTTIVTCPVCDQPIICQGFSYHACEDAFTITLKGQFHASRANAVQARTYIYSISRRHEAAGIEVEIMQDGDPNADYYNSGVVSDYERDQERIELEAAAADVSAQEHDYAAALARLAMLGSEQAEHEDAVWEADQHPGFLPLAPLMDRAV
jgi:multidrug resistance efflux pump